MRLMKDHLVTEDHFRKACVYCGKELKGWKPMHVSEVFYSMVRCGCGKKAVVRMPFLGSGHDSWHSTVFEVPPDRKIKLRTLENKLKVIK
ncbi:MAG: hypothetical protein ABIF10_03775 [Candidatus Woesearchaeota archaeon]